MPKKINDGLTNHQRYHAKPEKKAMRDENAKRWRQTDKGKFIRNRNHWIASGMVEPLEGWESFWEVFKKKTHCELCNIEFDLEAGGTSKKGRCLDHHHHSGTIRNVICRSCNISPMRKFDANHDRMLFEIQRYFRINTLQ
tara:strand:+ start:977 stop:1396 length:420 start_codon:yes stop_codon:yes gene_type:complete